MYSIDDVNAMDAEAFAQAFGGVYEHSAWVARRAYAAAPFPSIDALHASMQKALLEATPEAQLALIRAHPQLLGKLAPMEVLTADSQQEQRAAGLDQCTPAELAQLKTLNQAYLERFGFPFVVAVRGLSRADIITRFEQRLSGDRAQEFATALAEIGKIARLRLGLLVIPARS